MPARIAIRLSSRDDVWAQTLMAPTSKTWQRRSPDSEVSVEVATCGVQNKGTYLGPCALNYAPDSVSTLCDESTKRCVAPEASCEGGWCYIPPRSFDGGAPNEATSEGGFGSVNSEPRSIMNVPRAIVMMETEVTVAMFEATMEYLPDTGPFCGDDCPVAGVTIFEAMNFANRFSVRDGLPECYVLEGCRTDALMWHETPVSVWQCENSTFVGPECQGFRLPSGREWELGARAGSPNCLSRGTAELRVDCGPYDLSSWAHRLATFCGNAASTTDACPHTCPDDSMASAPQNRCTVDPEVVPDPAQAVCLSPQPVRSREPNPFGLYGMHGNIGEWTQSARPWVLDDLYSPVPSEPSQQMAMTAEFESVMRRTGHALVASIGYWYNLPSSCGNSLDIWFLEDAAQIPRFQLFGFRLVRTVPSR